MRPMQRATEDALAAIAPALEGEARAITERFGITEQSIIALFLADANHDGKFREAVAALEPYGLTRAQFTSGDFFRLYRELTITPFFH